MKPTVIKMKLVIGNKNYSSWSLRPWLLLNQFDVGFEEVLVSLRPEGRSERLRQYSSAGKVQVLNALPIFAPLVP